VSTHQCPIVVVVGDEAVDGATALAATITPPSPTTITSGSKSELDPDEATAARPWAPPPQERGLDGTLGVKPARLRNAPHDRVI
jgi:hypothetical protein